MLKMKSGQVIPYTDTCNYLGNTICSHDENVIIDNAITDMNMRLNNFHLNFHIVIVALYQPYLGLIV